MAMTIMKIHQITRAILLTGFVFMILFLGLEYGLSHYFTRYASEVLERERQEELRVSWNQYFEQRKDVLITGLDGYANWSFLSDNILKGNDKAIESAFIDYRETLQNDYLMDFMAIHGMNRNLVFAFYDTFSTKESEEKINAIRHRTFEDLMNKEMRNSYEEEKKKCEANPGTRSKVWTSILNLQNEIFLVAYSYIADDNGLLISPDAAMVVGVRMSKIMQMASKVLPAKVRIHKDPQKDSYLEITENGFFPGETFYVSFSPHFIMQEIIQGTIFWMMIVQISLILLLIVLIFPLTINLYTRQLQEIIDNQTHELTTVNEKQTKLIKHLQDAFSSIRTLEGLIPICASCKKIRNDNGYWEQVEEYIKKHSEANFSHGICPECIKKLYPNVASKMEKEKSEKKNPPLH